MLVAWISLEEEVARELLLDKPKEDSQIKEEMICSTLAADPAIQAPRWVQQPIHHLQWTRHKWTHSRLAQWAILVVAHQLSNSNNKISQSSFLILCSWQVWPPTHNNNIKCKCRCNNNNSNKCTTRRWIIKVVWVVAWEWAEATLNNNNLIPKCKMPVEWAAASAAVPAWWVEAWVVDSLCSNNNSKAIHLILAWVSNSHSNSSSSSRLPVIVRLSTSDINGV